MVWVSDEYRARFLQLFEDFLDKSTVGGRPRNRELVANIGRIRSAVAEDLWQSAGSPPTNGARWWELWLTPTSDAVRSARRFADARDLATASRHLTLDERNVVWIYATWADLVDLPFTSVPVTEIRRPEFADTIEDRSREDQDALTQNLVERIDPTSDQAAPTVCHLDSGVRHSHVLLSGSLATEDVHTVVGTTNDRQNHGTPMAGLALFGSGFEELLLNGQPLALRHRLESVKMLPDSGPGHDPLAYGLVTAQAVSLPEASVVRQRVFCMPVTAPPDRGSGEPSLWSASVDALAAGVDIGASADGIALLGPPDPDAARLFVIAAGNVAWSEFAADYRSVCDTSGAQDPAQAWNALSVGAYTDLSATSSDPSYAGWTPLWPAGSVGGIA